MCIGAEVARACSWKPTEVKNVWSSSCISCMHIQTRCLGTEATPYLLFIPIIVHRFSISAKGPVSVMASYAGKLTASAPSGKDRLLSRGRAHVTWIQQQRNWGIDLLAIYVAASFRFLLVWSSAHVCDENESKGKQVQTLAISAYSRT